MEIAVFVDGVREGTFSGDVRWHVVGDLVRWAQEKQQSVRATFEQEVEAESARVRATAVSS